MQQFVSLLGYFIRRQFGPAHVTILSDKAGYFYKETTFAKAKIVQVGYTLSFLELQAKVTLFQFFALFRQWEMQKWNLRVPSSLYG